MPVTTRWQAPGDWSLSIDGGRLPAPKAVTNLLAVETQAFGHIVITPAWVDPAAYNRARLFDVSVYTGRYIAQRNRTDLSGDHVTAWISDGNGNGQVLGAVPSSTRTLAQWSTFFFSGSTNPLTAGTISGPAGTITWDPEAGMPWLEAWAYICKNFYREFQVTNDLRLNINTVGNLHGVPRVIVTPWWDGADVELYGMRAEIDAGRSLENYVDGVVVSNDSFEVIVNDPNWLFLDGNGNRVRTIKVIRDLSVDLSAMGDLADADGAIIWQPRDEARIRTDSYCPLSHLSPGAYIKVWDPDNRIYTLESNEWALYALGAPTETHYGGHICWPLTTRVYGITMQVRDGMGVYFVRGDGEIVDLTDYVRFETGMSTLEVGSAPKRVSSSVRRLGIGK